MKAILTFNLPKDQYEYESAAKGTVYRSLLHDMANEIRRHTKYGDEKEEATWKVFSDKFWELMNEYKIDPYEE